jgi:hypothetical protein
LGFDAPRQIEFACLFGKKLDSEIIFDVRFLISDFGMWGFWDVPTVVLINITKSQYHKISNIYTDGDEIDDKLQTSNRIYS